jgi:hypothetical protein
MASRHCVSPWGLAKETVILMMIAWATLFVSNEKDWSKFLVVLALVFPEQITGACLYHLYHVSFVSLG